MNLPLTIAWRYLRRPTDRLVSAGGTVSLLGLVIGVMALVISMALMTGYRQDLESKLLGGNAELYLFPMNRMIEQPREVLDTIETLPGVASATPAIFQQALVTSETHPTGEQVMLKGVENGHRNLPPMARQMIGGEDGLKTADGSPGVALGVYLARKLGVKPGESVTITVPTEHAGSFLPRSATFPIARIYDSGFFEFDSRWLFLDIDEARRLLRADGSANVIEIHTTPGTDLDEVSALISNATKKRYLISDWRKLNGQLFTLLRIQQLVLFIVIGLIVFVSTFNIVSTLIMTIHEKRREIGVLSAMGGDRRLIRRVFIWYGTLVGVFGTATGIAFGVLVSVIITRFHLISFGPEIAQVYFVSSIPFVNRPVDLATIALFSLAVSWLATLIPSMRAARLQPVEALRYE